MAEFVGALVRHRADAMRLRVDRELHGNTWHLDLVVPSEHWAALYRSSALGAPRSAWDAYRRDRAFWDALAERFADVLSTYARPDALTCHHEFVVPHVSVLEVERSRFEG